MRNKLFFISGLFSFLILSACSHTEPKPEAPVVQKATEPKSWTLGLNSELNFVAGKKNCVNLFDTLPEGIVKKHPETGELGKFTISSGKLPKGIKLSKDGLLCSEKAKAGKTSDVVFEYTEPEVNGQKRTIQSVMTN